MPRAAYAVKMLQIFEDKQKGEKDAPRTCLGRPTTASLEIALLFAVFFVVGGAPAPHVNESYYLTKAKHYWEPAWCAGDPPFLESADAHLLFYWTLGWLTKWFSLSTVAWIGRTVAWLLLAISWQRLSRRVVQRPFFAVLTALPFVALLSPGNFAGEWVVGGVEGKCFAYALVFWGLAAMAEGRWRVAWLWLGLASAFHVLVGGWATVVAGLVWFTEPRESRTPLLSMLPALLLGGVLSLPGIVPALQLTQGVSVETAAEANEIYVFERLPHHLAPLAMRSSELTKKSLRFGAMVLVFVALWLLVKNNATSFFSWSTLVPAQATLPSALTLLMKFAWGSLALSLFGFAWELVYWNQPAQAARLLKYYWFRLADVAVPLAVALAVGWLVSVLLERRPQGAALLLFVAISFPVWTLLDSSIDRYQNPAAPADRKLKDPNAWKEACLWARNNTPSDSMFLVPRGSQSFEWYAHRRGLVTWKDVPQDAASLVSWRDRYFDVFQRTNKENGKRSFVPLAEQGTERIRQLAQKYQTDYVITQAHVIAKEKTPLLLPTVYSNGAYKIYATTPLPK